MWSEVSLADLGSVERGRSRHRPRNDPSLYGGDYPFFQTGDIKAAGFRLRQHSATYNKAGLAQSRLWKPGTLCITIAANIADSAILAIPGCFPDSVVGFVPKPGVADVRFVKYLIDLTKAQMQNVSQGTTQDNLSLNKLLRFRFMCPAYPVQRRIASILSAYDDLIENNTRRIQILEEMAQAIYREWFVEFRFPGHEQVRMVDSELGLIPEGWRVEALKRVAGVNASTARADDELGLISYIDISSVSRGAFGWSSMEYRGAPGRARRRVLPCDVIWSTVRPNLRAYALVCEPPPNCVASTGFAVLSARTVPWSYLYAITTDEPFVAHLVNCATGSAYPAVTGRVFEEARIVVPHETTAAVFHAAAGPMYSLIAKLCSMSRNLRTARDLLLPRLISGEIDVSEFDTGEAEPAS